MMGMTFSIIWDSIGSDIDVAIHNQTTNENIWIIENGKPQLMAIQKVVKLLNKGGDGDD